MRRLCSPNVRSSRFACEAFCDAPQEGVAPEDTLRGSLPCTSSRSGIVDGTDDHLPTLLQPLLVAVRMEESHQPNPTPSDRRRACACRGKGRFCLRRTHRHYSQRPARDPLRSQGVSDWWFVDMILDGNPADSTLAETMIDRQVELYERAPRQVAYDGAFSSKANLEAIKGKGVEDVAFTNGQGSP